MRFFVNLTCELSRKLRKNPNKSRFCCVFMKIRCVTRPSLRRGHLWKPSAFAAQNIATSLQLLNKLEVCFRSEKVRVWRRSHEKFAQKMPKIPRKKCKTSGISACRSQKNYVQSASVRFALKSRNIAAALTEVENLFRSEKVRVRRRDHAKSAGKTHEF